MGWKKKVLRVDLTKETARTEPLNMEWAQKYIGLRGLGSKYLYEEIDPKVDPLSPKNKLIFATGPLTGTMAPTGGRYGVITKGALTEALACSNSGGKWGAEFKFAGYDLLIVEGRAKRPVYICIEDDDVRILAADDLWGTTVWHTETALQRRHHSQMKVASIGEAGEYGCRFACIVNDMDRAAGRSGVGTVMGSKNLKAIAVRGTKGARADDMPAFMAATAAAKQALATAEDPIGLTPPGVSLSENLARHGTIMMVNITNAFGSLPTRNNRQVQFEGAWNISDEAQIETLPDGHSNLITNSACFACTIGCGRVSHIHPNHFSVKDRPEYRIASGGLEFEAAYALGSMVGVDDIDAATFAGFMCNEHGMDPISLGGSIAAAMELFEEGVITTKETGGLELRFGDAEALVRVSEMIGKGEGFGQDIGLGSKRLCEKYGRPEFSMTVKGQEFAGYDSRAQQGMGLGYATSNRGACHMRANVSQEIGLEANYIADLMNAACEGDWNLARMRECGERTWNLERQFNLAAGFTAKDDTLPKRLLETPAPSGTAKGLVSRLPEMLPEYYALRGWTPDGQPADATLRRLDL
jgi:aldehyde:ferredoxin oxidoreductase